MTWLGTDSPLWSMYVGYQPFDFSPSWSKWSGRKIAALDDLHPKDSPALPDGSRWVDAEALRRVVAHVAGVSP